MTFEATVTLSDIFGGISLIFIIIGGIFSYYQWKRNVSLKGAEYINILNERIYTDSFISYSLYLLDYGQSWYSKEFHFSRNLELKMDKTLSYFSYICYLKNRRL